MAKTQNQGGSNTIDNTTGVTDQEANVDIAVIETVAVGPNGIHFIDRIDSGTAAPNLDENSLVVTVRSTVADRLAGTVVTEAIWRAEPNLNVIMKRATDPSVRARCAEFFLRYEAAGVITSILPDRITIEEGKSLVLANELFDALSAAVAEPSAIMVLMELVNSFLIRCGIMVDTAKFTSRSYYPFQAVTVDKLANDIAMEEVVRSLNHVKEAKVADRKYTAKSFAETVAEALYPLGKGFLEVNELGGIFDDMVKGVRKNLDPELRGGLEGNIDDAWAKNPVIQELSSNYVFVAAALGLRDRISITNEHWKLSQYAPVILAALKSSKRYAIVNRAEVVRNMGLRKVRDNHDLPLSFVLWRSADPQPVAQSVFAFTDSRLDIAVTISPTKERIADAIASAYGDVKGLGTTSAATTLHQFLTHAVEAGYRGLRGGYHVDLGEFTTVSDHELACLTADSIRVVTDADGMYPTVRPGTSVPESGWWYKIATREHDFPFLYSGKMLDRNTIVTDQLQEVFIAMDEFEPASAVEPRPQLIAPMAFDTRMIGFDTGNDLVPLNSRYTFTTKFAGKEIHGSFRAADIGSLRVNELTSLVVPAYNRDVFTVVAYVYNVIAAELKRMYQRAGDTNEAPAEVVAFLNRQYGRSLLDYSQNLAEGFRQEVENGMKERAVSKMSPEEAFVMRARLTQREFGGYADVNALLLFLTLQGIDGTPWKNALTQADLTRIFMDYGTDRKRV